VNRTAAEGSVQGGSAEPGGTAPERVPSGGGVFVRCEGAAYTYRSGTRALTDINLEIAEGEFAAVVGHNGSGKSTLAMLLSGLEQPGAGTVTLGGINTRDKSKGRELRKHCGMVFQNPENQLVFERVADDIAFGLKNLGFTGTEAAERIAEVSRILGIGHFSGSFELSMGQKQRVAIAGVLAMNPRGIIFDEPTAMLDPRGKKEIHRIIVDLHRRGLTIIYVTNVIDEVLSADRIILLNQGRIGGEFKREELPSRLGELKALGLEAPVILDVAERLKARGLAVALKDFSIEGLVGGIAAAAGLPALPVEAPPAKPDREAKP
jgi:energy-coupling factor transport system ATP-binding protein